MVLVLAGAALLMGGTLPKSRTVEAEKFIPQDASGKRRATLGVGAKDSTGVELQDRDGKQRALLGALPDGSPNVNRFDEDG